MGILWRKRSLLLKLVVIIGTAWFTIAFLLYTDNSVQSQNGVAMRLEGDSVKKTNKKVEHLPNQMNPFEVETPRTELAVKKQDDDSGVLLPPQEMAGEMGKPVILPANLSGDIKKLVDKGWLNNAFNQYASDLISVHRSLPDPRDEWCKTPGLYLENLPSTSVIICFHNEAWSVLLRTVHSVLDRSPKHLIEEVILVDDFSDMPHTKDQLEEYWLKEPRVKIVRAKKREGLIRARLLDNTWTSDGYPLNIHYAYAGCTMDVQFMSEGFAIDVQGVFGGYQPVRL